jgi:TM2 domain-containing membrane protein YozV/DNA-directed RNA polymerase subunit RPC12/RpoP
VPLTPTISFTCQQCGNKFSAPASAAGRSVACKCGMKVTIPSVSQALGPTPQPMPKTIQPHTHYPPTPQPQYQVPPQQQYQPIPQPQYQLTQGPQVVGMSQPTKFCHACGQTLDARAEICPKCGVRQMGMSPGSGRNRLMAALLALFLGGFGVHHFYLGRPILGVIYLLFCWTFIPAIVAFIEALVLLCMSDQTFHSKYPD